MGKGKHVRRDLKSKNRSKLGGNIEKSRQRTKSEREKKNLLFHASDIQQLPPLTYLKKKILYYVTKKGF